MDGTPDKPAHFFDFERAKGFWAQLTTRDELDSAAVACDAGPYSQWIEGFHQNKAAAIKSLGERSDAEKIRACYDLQMAYNVWAKVYSTKLRDGVQEWNQADEEGSYCKWAAHYNVFGDTCNGLPDWRVMEQ